MYVFISSLFAIATNSKTFHLDQDLTANNRQYILEGAVTEIGKMPITHYLFLFNDLLIWTQQINKKKFMYRRHNFLSRLTAVAGELNSVRIITDEGETKVRLPSRKNTLDHNCHKLTIHFLITDIYQVERRAKQVDYISRK